MYHPRQQPPAASPSSPTIISNNNPSLTKRLLRGTLISTLLFISGFITVQIYITLPYLTPTTHPANSKRDLDLFHSSSVKVNSSFLVQSLIAEGWVEDPPSMITGTKPPIEDTQTSNTMGKHLVHDTLPRPGIRSLILRTFRHPTSEVSLVVVHVGPGCESWPQFAHGGVTTTLLIEAVESHIVHYYPDLALLTERDVTVKFKAPIRVSGIYAITVSPIVNHVTNGKTVVSIAASLDQLPFPPKITKHSDLDHASVDIKKDDAQPLATAQIRLPVT